VYQSQGDHDLAIADFNEFLRLNPTGSSGFYARGNSYREKGDLDRAIADYSEAIRLDPRFSFAYHDRGVARRMKGDREQAISDFRQAVRLSPATAGPSQAALESLGVGEPKTEPGAPKRGVLDLLK
jgi:tetratricopeptide (TPR) repeat protein